MSRARSPGWDASDDPDGGGGGGINTTLVLMVLAALVGLSRPVCWEFWPRRYQIAMGGLVVAAADDWVSHALGWSTPLDLAFKQYGIEGSALMIVAVAVVGFVLLRIIPERELSDLVR